MKKTGFLVQEFSCFVDICVFSLYAIVRYLQPLPGTTVFDGKGEASSQ
ncbi:MAG: hypothetical protein HQM10_24560 [Candidatus Riflebacteria bacterium]|nr:hypothetical protein [Candidatus Riflebacteria bacterium]